MSSRDLTVSEEAPRRQDLFSQMAAPLMGGVAIDPEISDRLRDAYADGLVVHVIRSSRVLDPIFVRVVLERLGLQAPRWMHDHYASEGPPTVDAMRQAVLRGEPILLFLRQPKTLTSPTSAYSGHHVEALITLSRELDRPILLLPVSLLWNRRSMGLRRTIVDVVFGDRENPGRMRELLGFVFNRKNARFHVGTPVNVTAVVEREAGRTNAVISKKIRWSILHHLAREEAIRAGPNQRSATRTRQLVLKDPDVAAVLGDDDGKRIEAENMLMRMAADVRFGWLRVLDVVLDRVWRDIYDGIEIDQEGLRKVWSAARSGPIVLVPSHKSHVDYLVLSQVFFKDGMMPPHIAAGDNLAMPGVGAILRRSGAFFIRRKFRGDKLYAAVLAAYVRRLLKDGHSVEFFIEGGRSRTGKMLKPKLGMLGMCVDPVLDGGITDVSFVPVSISYEKIVEAKAFAKELDGQAKKKEDLGALVSARKVLRSRYGRVYVDFDEPISLRAFAAARGFEIRPRHELRDEEVRDPRELILQLGHRLVFGISRVTRITPTGVAALVLLAQTRRGMAESELQRRAQRLIAFSVRTGARLSETLADHTCQSALREALGRLAGDRLLLMTPSPDGETIYQLEAEGRRALDYYKNNALHFFAPHTIVAMALLSAPEEEGDREAIIERAHRLGTLLDAELPFPTGADLMVQCRAAVRDLSEQRVISDYDGRLAVTRNGREQAVELAGMIAVFIEAYRSVAETLGSLPTRPIARSDIIDLAINRGRKQVLEGRMKRPEAVSKLTVGNALDAFVQANLIGRSDDGLFLSDDSNRAIDALDDLLVAALKAADG